MVVETEVPALEIDHTWKGLNLDGKRKLMGKCLRHYLGILFWVKNQDHLKSEISRIWDLQLCYSRSYRITPV